MEHIFAMSLEDRLREVRQSKGLNQEAFAAIAGVSKKTQTNYEIGKHKPTGDYWEALANAGIDVAYILTGRRDPKLLTEEQRRLVDMYGGLSEARQRELMAKATDLFIDEGRDKPRAGQRMREGKDNQVKMNIRPVEK
jgi:transcriptional regulator with XRE-family HTH domain